MTKKITKSELRELTVPNDWTAYLEPQSLMMNPGKDEWRKRLTNTMLIWADQEKPLEIMEFCIKYRIPYSTLRDLVRQYPDIEKVYNEVKLMIACNRRVGSMRKQLDANSAYRDMHVLDPEWHFVNKYQADLKKDETHQSHTFVINMEKPHVTTQEELKIEVDRTNE